MADIRLAFPHLDEPDKSLGPILCDYYDRMKALETDKERGGKQATLIVMTIQNIKNALNL